MVSQGVFAGHQGTDTPEADDKDLLELLQTCDYNPEKENDKLVRFLGTLFSLRPGIENWATSIKSIQEKAESDTDISSNLAYTTILANRKNNDASIFLDRALRTFVQACEDNAQDAKKMFMLFENLGTKRAVDWCCDQTSDPVLQKSAGKMYGVLGCKAQTLQISSCSQEDQKKMLKKSIALFFCGCRNSCFTEEDRVFGQAVSDRLFIYENTFSDSISKWMLLWYYQAKEGASKKDAVGTGAISPAQKSFCKAMSLYYQKEYGKAYDMFFKTELDAQGIEPDVARIARWYSNSMILEKQVDHGCNKDADHLMSEMADIGSDFVRQQDVMLLRAITPDAVKKVIHERADMSNSAYHKLLDQKKDSSCDLSQPDDINLWYTAGRLGGIDFDPKVAKNAVMLAQDAASFGHLPSLYFLAVSDSPFFSVSNRFDAIISFLERTNKISADECMVKEVESALQRFAEDGNLQALVNFCGRQHDHNKLKDWLEHMSDISKLKLVETARANDMWERTCSEKTGYYYLKEYADTSPVARIIVAACDMENAFCKEDPSAVEGTITQSVKTILDCQKKGSLDSSVLTYLADACCCLGRAFLAWHEFEAACVHLKKAISINSSDEGYRVLALVNFLKYSQSQNRDVFYNLGMRLLEEGSHKGGLETKVLYIHTLLQASKHKQAYAELTKTNNSNNVMLALMKEHWDIFAAAAGAAHTFKIEDLAHLYSSATNLANCGFSSYAAVIYDALSRLGFVGADIGIIELYVASNIFITDQQVTKCYQRIVQYLLNNSDDQLIQRLGHLKTGTTIHAEKDDLTELASYRAKFVKSMLEKVEVKSSAEVNLAQGSTIFTKMYQAAQDDAITNDSNAEKLDTQQVHESKDLEQKARKKKKKNKKKKLARKSRGELPSSGQETDLVVSSVIQDIEAAFEYVDQTERKIGIFMSKAGVDALCCAFDLLKKTLEFLSGKDIVSQNARLKAKVANHVRFFLGLIRNKETLNTDLRDQVNCIAECFQTQLSEKIFEEIEICKDELVLVNY